MSSHAQSMVRQYGVSMDAHESYQNTPIQCRNFTDYVNNNLSIGHDGTAQPQRYICLARLREYWTKRTIEAVLSAYGIHVHIDTISNHYLRVFSTLVYIEYATWLLDFTEERLPDQEFPYKRIPTCWLDAPRANEMWNKFYRYQWMFFPFKFNPNHLLSTRLDPQLIFPMEQTQLLAGGNTANVYKIVVHPDYNDLRKFYQGREHDTFVLKTFVGDRNQELFENEKRALVTLQNNPSKHIVTFYGSFQQADRRSLILEYVSGGTLRDYLQRTPPPTSLQDIQDFWNSLANVLQGLFRVHQLRSPDEGADYHIIHGDLKPDNILLVKETGNTPYKFTAKIADFGLSHMRAVSPQETDRLGLDQHGSPTYSAPEGTHHQRWMQTGPNRVSEAVDIWAMGCIFSEVAAWLHAGAEGISQYLEMRRNELRGLVTFEGSAYGDCFHDGINKALTAVGEMHRHITDSRPYWDNLTHDILRVVEEYMLAQNQHNRWKAKPLLEKLQQIINASQTGHRASLPTTYSSPFSAPQQNHTSRNSSLTDRAALHNIRTPDFKPSPQDIVASPSSNPISPMSIANPAPSPVGSNLTQVQQIVDSRTKDYFPPVAVANATAINGTDGRPRPTAGAPANLYLSIEDVLNYRKVKKEGLPIASRVGELIGGLKKNLRSRDHIFFIEDSPSMQQHSEDTVRIFTALSYLAKQIDKDDIELVFASEPTKIHEHPHTTPLIEILEKHKYEGGQNMMENQLGEFIENRVIKQLPGSTFTTFPSRRSLRPKKPLSIFVFTNACWGQGLDEAAGVENPIQNLMRKITQRGLNRAHVMIQFIRFGNDADGIRYLKHLDDFGRKEKCDIVDTRSANGNVYAMFVGSISPVMDNDEEPTGGSELP